jgi:lathosterol oxidase
MAHLNMIDLLKLYGLIFFLLILFYYFLPAGIWYYIFFIRKRESWKHMRVQKHFPKEKQILREIRYSILSVAIFSLVGLGLVLSIQNGQTLMYFDAGSYGIIYFVLSPLIAFILHDTVFYWVHRLMHLKIFFRHFHLVHHKSTNPTPFSIYAFQPGEALLQSSMYALILFVIPIHPYMLSFFMAYNTFINLSGHSGFEFMPEKFRKHWLYRLQNSVSNHDLHHTKFNCNYGFYYTFWDRIMNTLKESNEEKQHEKNEA